MLTIILHDLREPQIQATYLKEVASNLLINRISTAEGAAAVEEQVNNIFPVTWRKKDPRPTKSHTGEKPKERRRRQYGSIQRLLNLSRKDAASAVLDGSWREASYGAPREPPGLVDYWAKVIGREGPPPTITGMETGRKHWALLEPITEGELRESLKTLTKSAAGMDN